MNAKNTHCKWCAAINCKNSRNRRPDLSFFGFPSNPDQLRQWIVNCRRADLELADPRRVARNCCLCSDHFEERYFSKKTTKRPRLVKGAIPTIFNTTISPSKLCSRRSRKKVSVAFSPALPSTSSELSKPVFAERPSAQKSRIGNGNTSGNSSSGAGTADQHIYVDHQGNPCIRIGLEGMEMDTDSGTGIPDGVASYVEVARHPESDSSSTLSNVESNEDQMKDLAEFAQSASEVLRRIIKSEPLDDIDSPCISQENADVKEELNTSDSQAFTSSGSERAETHKNAIKEEPLTETEEDLVDPETVMDVNPPPQHKDMISSTCQRAANAHYHVQDPTDGSIKTVPKKLGTQPDCRKGKRVFEDSAKQRGGCGNGGMSENGPKQEQCEIFVYSCRHVCKACEHSKCEDLRHIYESVDVRLCSCLDPQSDVQGQKLKSSSSSTNCRHVNSSHLPSKDLPKSLETSDVTTAVGSSNSLVIRDILQRPPKFDTLQTGTFEAGKVITQTLPRASLQRSVCKSSDTSALSSTSPHVWFSSNRQTDLIKTPSGSRFMIVNAGSSPMSFTLPPFQAMVVNMHPCPDSLLSSPCSASLPNLES